MMLPGFFTNRKKSLSNADGSVPPSSFWTKWGPFKEEAANMASGY